MHYSKRKKRNDKRALKIVEKAIWDWKYTHTELNDAARHFEETNPKASKIITEIMEEEERLVEQADLVLHPLLYKLKKAIKKKLG